MFKIHVSAFLKELNIRVNDVNRFRSHISCKLLSCKDVAESLSVTMATISNLNSDSKISLVWSIAGVILDSYYELFEWEYSFACKFYPDESNRMAEIDSIVYELYHWYGEDFRERVRRP